MPRLTFVIGRISIAVALAILCLAAEADGSTGWKHVNVTRRSGVIEASLSYDQGRTSFGLSVRRARLFVRRAGDTVIDAQLRNVSLGSTDAKLELELRNAWGNAGPQAIVRASSCENRCGEKLFVGLVPKSGPGRLLAHDFGGGLPGPDTAWGGQRRDGAFYFVATDRRFFCVFTDCASSTVPVRVFLIDASGRQFVDVTRTRPDLVRADASSLFAQYQRQIRFKEYNTEKRPGYDPMGVLGPWCADEYLLGRASHCHLTLVHAAADGYLWRWTRTRLDSFYKHLNAWGYA